MRALAATQYQKRGATLCLQLPPGLPGGRHNLRPYRVAGAHRFFGWEGWLTRNRDANSVHQAASKAVGQTGHGILFVNGRGYAEHFSGQQNRPGDITAHAKD